MDRKTKVLANGGRYDALLASFRDAAISQPVPYNNEQNDCLVMNCQQSAVGGVIFANQLIAVMEERKQSSKRLIKAVICVVGDSTDSNPSNFNALTNSLELSQVEFVWIGFLQVRNPSKLSALIYLFFF